MTKKIMTKKISVDFSKRAGKMMFCAYCGKEIPEGEAQTKEGKPFHKQCLALVNSF